MKKFYGIVLLLLLVGCNDLDSSNSIKTEVNQYPDETESTLMYEFTDPDFSFGESLDFTNLTKESEIELVNHTVIDIYDISSKSVLTIDNYLLGLETFDDLIKTKSGIGVYDSVNELLHKYSEYQVLNHGETYFIYDDQYVLSFYSSEGIIGSFGIYDLDLYPAYMNMTFNTLLIESVLFDSPITMNLDTEVEEELEEIASNIVSKGDLDELEEIIVDHQLTEVNEPIVEADNVTVDDTMIPTEFSKTIQIGEDESVVTNFFGDMDSYSKHEHGAYTQHIRPPNSFLTSEGVVQLVAWGRSGLYEEWKNKEGIGRTSTIEDAKNAYQNFEYKLLYQKGLALPSYMMIEYSGDLLVLEFLRGEVSLIFRCAPEMIDTLPVINYYFTSDQLENHPF